LKQLITLVDHKIGEKTEEHPRFIKQGQVVIGKFELLQVGKGICMELFEYYPQLGQFTLHDKDRTVAVGKVLEIIE